MTPHISVLSNMRIAGAISLDDNGEDFPSGVVPGTLAVKGATLYAYITLNGMDTWYPIVRNVSATHVHTQGLDAVVWTVNHGLNSSEVWYQVQDQDGQMLSYSSFERVNENTFRLHFSEPVRGTVLVVGPNSIDTTTIKASLIEVGANVVIDTTGMLINGVRVIGPDAVSLTQVTEIVDDAVVALKDGVTPDGDTLDKLNTKIGQINTLLGTNDVDMDTLQEVVTRIKSDEGLLASLTTNKADIVYVDAELALKASTVEMNTAISQALSTIKQSVRSTTTGALAVLTGTARMYPSDNMTVRSAFAAVNTPPSGDDIKIDILKNGVSILGGVFLTIPASQNKSVVLPITASLTPDDYLTIDIVQVGTMVAGSDLVVTIHY